MKITCPNCETSYKLAEGAIRAGGRKVRCTRCGTTWVARADDPPPQPPARDESAAEAEWAAMEATTPPAQDPPPELPPVGEPSDDEWRAALTGPERRPVTGGLLPMDDEAEKPAGDLFDPGLPDTSSDTAGVDPSMDSSGAVIPFERPVADDGGAGPATPVIEQDPPGFNRRAATKKKAPAKKKARLPQIWVRILSSMGLTIAGALVAGLLAGSLFAREAVVRRFPDLAGLYGLIGLEVNLRGLAFHDVRTFRELDGSTPVLVVDGMIENVSDSGRPVPRLRFGLRSTSGREVYAWTMEPAVQTLEPGGRTNFRSRLPAPPEAATDVQVRFTDRRGP
jgi:predicted Zn finger-like uncharacterized protein